MINLRILETSIFKIAEPLNAKEEKTLYSQTGTWSATSRCGAESCQLGPAQRAGELQKQKETIFILLF